MESINLGTPNNNDGDSLYAGGTKINANFAELYTALAGSTSGTILIQLDDMSAVTGNALRYSAQQGKFVSVSSTSMRSLGADGATLLYLTNDAGLAGVDNDLVGPPNSLNAVINGRRLFTLRARNTSVTTSTRGEWHIGMGLTNVTSVSIYTTGLTVRGLYGLEVFVSPAEDNAAYTQLLSSSSNGIRLYGTPVLDVASGATRPISDSSNSIAHTGFVRLYTERYASSSFTITVNNGLVGGGDATQASRNIGIDPRFYPHLCQGYLYSYNSVASTLSVAPGSCTHYSYGTADVANISTTSILALVANTSTMTKTWATGWSVAGSNAVLDATITADTWYYIYLIAHNISGAPDFIVSSQKTVNGAISALGAVTGEWSVIRRLGCVRSDSSGTPAPLPFTVNKVADSTIFYSWGKLAAVGAINPITASHSAYRRNIITTLQITPIGTSVAATATAESFFSSNLTYVPPIPGVTAKLNVIWNPSFTSQNPALYLYGYGMHHSSISTNIQGAPMEIISRGTVSNLTSNTTVMLPMSPEREQLTETNLANTSIFPNAGQTLRFILTNAVTANNSAAPVAQNYLAFDTLGFNVTR